MPKSKRVTVKPRAVVKAIMGQNPEAAQRNLSDLIQHPVVLSEAYRVVEPIQEQLAPKKVTQQLRKHLGTIQGALPDQKLVELGKFTASKLYTEVTTAEQFSLWTLALLEAFKSYSLEDLAARPQLQELFEAMLGMLSSHAKELHETTPLIVDTIFSTIGEKVKELFTSATDDLQRSKELSGKAQRKGESKPAKEPNHCYRLCRNLLKNLERFYLSDRFLVSLLNEDQQAETRDAYRYNLGSVLVASGLKEEARLHLVTSYNYRLSKFGPDNDRTKKVKAKLDQHFPEARAPSSPRLMSSPGAGVDGAAPALAPRFK